MNILSIASNVFIKGPNRRTSYRSIVPQGESILVPILQDRWLTLLLFGASVVHLCLTAAGFSGWQCPLRSIADISCPGCGLSAAVICLLTGHWQIALTTHALAPLALGSIFFLGSITLMPNSLRQKVIRWIAGVDQKMHLISLIIGVVLFHWGIQLIR